MRIDAISLGANPPHEVNAIIEVPVGGEPIKYEMDKEAGTLVVDRFLYTAMRYPGNYGFIPHTLSSDGDPCDVLVANTRAIVPGAVIAIRPVGVLMMEDEAGGDADTRYAHDDLLQFSERATSSAGWSFPTASTMYCLPPSMYVIGLPLATPGNGSSATTRPLALS